MHPYTQALCNLLQPHASAADAAPMAAYMRDQFPFLGIKTPARRLLLRQFLTARGLPPFAELEQIVRDLWALPEREYQYCALSLLDRLIQHAPPDYVDLLAFLITTNSWWDTVDSLAGHSVSVHFRRYPEVRATAVAAWRASDNIWLRRSTLLFQLSWKTATDAPLLFALIEENCGSNEFFIQKAIGWALREYSKTDAAAVQAFVAATPLAPLSAREALKWLNRKGKDT